MTRQEIEEEMWSTEYLEHLNAFAHFCSEMSDKQYGREETNNAWYFFKAGWVSAVDQERNLWRII